MFSKAHIPLAAAASLTVALGSKLQNYTIDNIYLLSGSIIGSILPDIDHHESWITTLIPIKIHKILKHRSIITHNLLLPICIFSYSIVTQNHFLLGLSVGYASHLISDFLNFDSNRCYIVSWIFIAILSFTLWNFKFIENEVIQWIMKNL